MRRTLTTWILATIVAAGIITTGNAPQPVVEDQIQRVAAPTELVSLQRNVDGNRTRFDEAIKEAKKANAQTVTLQEVCESWMDALPSHWKHHYETTKPEATNHCPGPGKTGKGVVAIWTESKSVTKDSVKLKADAGRTPHMACLNVNGSGGHTVCSTHLVAYKDLCEDKNDPDPECHQPADDIRKTQARQIKEHFATLLRKDKNRRIILGGDFNTAPKSPPLDHLYAKPAAQSNGGMLTEGSQLANNGKGVAGRAGKDTTSGRKIDYLFFSDNFVSHGQSGGMDVGPIPPSDDPKKKYKGHARLLARVNLGSAAGDAPPRVPVPTCDNDCYRAQLGTQSYVYNENSNASDPRLRRFIFDRKFYIDAYPDVRAWAQGKVQTQGGNLYDHVQWHWLNYGIPWGRMGSGTFDPAYYLSVQPDVAAAYGPTNYAGAIDHFVVFGQNEGRRGSIFFDVNYYKNRYGDLAGHSVRDALHHFTVYGMSEGRQGSAQFGPAYYMGSNVDLRNAFGANQYRRGMSHWISNGHAEGRPGAP